MFFYDNYFANMISRYLETLKDAVIAWKYAEFIF